MITKSIICTVLIVMAPLSALAAQPAASLPAAPIQAPAVNSLGQIDFQQSLTLTGTVKFVQLGPVRSRVQVLVTDPKGQVREWSLEGPTQNILAKFGNGHRAIAQWDKVTFGINPLIGAAASGEIRTLTSVNEMQVSP